MVEVDEEKGKGLVTTGGREGEATIGGSKGMHALTREDTGH